MRSRQLEKIALLVILSCVISALGMIEQERSSEETERPQVQRVGPNQFRLGTIEIDTRQRTLTVPGKVNDVTVLEFVATAREGLKSYESALELETDAVSFNLALILLGLDQHKGAPAEFHFDPTPPVGDPVAIWVEWDYRGEPRRIRAEELVYSLISKEPLAESPWVYTGSVFLPDGDYLAELDGVLVGFVHTPSSVIDRPLSDAISNYGAFVLNPNLGLEPGTAVEIVVEVISTEPIE